MQVPSQVQRGSGEGSEGSGEGLGGFGAEPGHVQQGSGEGSGEGLGGFGVVVVAVVVVVVVAVVSNNKIVSIPISIVLLPSALLAPTLQA